MADEEMSYERGRETGVIIAKLESIEKLLKTMTDGVGALELRVRNLENWRYLVVGAGAAAGVVANLAMRALLK